MVNKAERAESTAQLAHQLFDFMPLVVEHVNTRLAEYDMTNTDYWAVRTLDGPMPMSELAHCMEFDPSYVTIVADRLEKLGLVERQPHPTDRRIKNLVLTTKGLRLKRDIPKTLWNDPSTFSALTETELDQFVSLLAKLQVANQK